MNKLREKSDCPITATLELIGGKWKTVILYTLSTGTKRFGEIAVRIPGISRKVLTEQLKELETDGLVQRSQFNETPPRVDYSVTSLADSLQPVLRAMEIWGMENVILKR